MPKNPLTLHNIVVGCYGLTCIYAAIQPDTPLVWAVVFLLLGVGLCMYIYRRL